MSRATERRPTPRGFRAWVARQKGPYQYQNPSACPMANYARWVFPRARTVRAGYSWVQVDGTMYPVAADGMTTLNKIATPPLTYEALQERFAVEPLPVPPYKPGKLGAFKRGASA